MAQDASEAYEAAVRAAEAAYTDAYTTVNADRQAAYTIADNVFAAAMEPHRQMRDTAVNDAEATYRAAVGMDPAVFDVADGDNGKAGDR